MSSLVEVPCDYTEPNSYVCSKFRKGRVLICGEIGYSIPQEIVCPKCLGTGKINRDIKEIRNEIQTLKKDIELINNEVSILEGYLLSGSN